jgi:hypothetical protein
MMSLIILAGAGLLIAAMVNTRKMREMAHRERLAMIDRGLIPSPERDPAGFEAQAGLTVRRVSSSAVRFRTAGVVLIGIGFGLMVLITFSAGQADVGFGIGGAWVAVGAALLLNYFLMTRREEHTDPAMPTRWTPPRPPEPPSNIAP